MELDTSSWSGDGDFTQLLLERLRGQPRIAHVRVEDALASREDVGYSFISNELFVSPVVEWRQVAVRRWGIVPSRRLVPEMSMTSRELEAVLAVDGEIGPADFADEGMLQYLRTQRIVPAYQTRGYKLVELVRIYLVGARTPR